MRMTDATRPIDTDAVRDALKTVIDRNDGIAVRITITSPACPIGQMILDDFVDVRRSAA